MSISSVPWPDKPPPVSVWQMSVERYHAMIRAGLLTEDDRVELLAGIPGYWIISLGEATIGVCHEPRATHYAVEDHYRLGDNVPLVLDGREIGHIPVSQLLTDS